MFEYIKRKYQEWQRERDWRPTDICHLRSMIIYMHALNPNESLENPMELNKEDGVNGGMVTIDTTELAKTVGEGEAIEQAMDFVRSLRSQFEKQNLQCSPPYTDRDNPRLLRLPLTNYRLTTREKTLNRMKRVIYPKITNEEQEAAGKKSKWDEEKAGVLDKRYTDLLSEYRKVIPPDQLESFLDQEMRKAEQEYDRNHPNDGRSR